MNNIIEVKDLTKKYGDFTAVDAINFQVREGEIFGILGPNGAGKTTTLEMMEGLKAITSGTVTLDGHDVSIEPNKVKSLIGVQLQSSSFFDGLNLKELVETFGSLYGRKVDGLELLCKVQLEDKQESQIKELSGGQKQRLSIAVALVNDPKVIFLDEPTTGLDPQARRNLWELIADINQSGKTVLITTHYMDEAEVLCNRIAVMDHSKIIALDETKNLLKFPGLSSYIDFEANKPCDQAHLEALGSVDSMEQRGLNYKLFTKNPELALPGLFQHSHVCGFSILNLQVKNPTLEDVFIKLTGHALRD